MTTKDESTKSKQQVTEEEETGKATVFSLNTGRKSPNEPERKKIRTTRDMRVWSGLPIKETFECYCGAVIDQDSAYVSPTLTDARYYPYYVCPTCYHRQKSQRSKMDKGDTE